MVRALTAAVPVWLTVAVLIFNTPGRTKLIVGAVFAASLVAPANGLLLVAVLAPFGRLLQTGLDLGPFRMTEAIVVAFLAGWAIAPRTVHRGPRLPVMPIALMGAVVIASLIAQMWHAATMPDVLPDALQVLFQAYYLIPDAVGFAAAARVFEGLALLAAVVVLMRADVRVADRLPFALTVGALGAALSSLLAARGIAPAEVLATRLAGRISAHTGDVNAASSYFGMLMFVALGMAGRREGRARVIWIAVAIVDAAAMWATGSRTGAAVAAIVLFMAAIMTATAGARPRIRAAWLAIVLVGALGLAALRGYTLRTDPGASFRRQFTIGSLEMIAARPLTGVGIGQYYDASPLFLTPEMAWVYGAENAHDYFLQMCGELGIPGLIVFLTLISAIVVRAARALALAPRDWRLLGALCGAIALLATSLTSHPLLVDEVAHAFWLMAGLTVALSGSILWADPGERAPGATDDARRAAIARPAWQRPAIAASATFAAFLIVSVWVGRHPLEPSTSPEVTGLSPWETAPDGARFRWTSEFSSIFVPRNVTRVYIPVHMPIDLPRLTPIGVTARMVRQDRASLGVSDTWDVLNVELPPLQTLQQYKRVDLKVDRTWKPAIYIPGNSDLRTVGVQIGEIKRFYEY